jgi:hypothetical protein
MKVQYFGDVNDYRKFALLRLLSQVGQFKIGVCWMLTEDDASGQGDRRSYLKQPEKWRAYDPATFDALAKAPAAPTINDLRRVEAEALVPNAAFFNEFTPDSRLGRESFHTQCMEVFADQDLVFLDPDNGLEVTIPKGRKRSSKYAYLDEIADHYNAGRSILLYQHYSRNVSREASVTAKSSSLRTQSPRASIWLFETPHVAFVLAARPDHARHVETAIATLQDRRWLPKFFTNARIAPLSDKIRRETPSETG